MAAGWFLSASTASETRFSVNRTPGDLAGLERLARSATFGRLLLIVSVAAGSFSVEAIESGGMLSASDWINIAIAIVGLLVTIGLAIASGVGGILIYFVYRFFESTHAQLEKLLDQVTATNHKITEHAAFRDGDRRDIDSLIDGHGRHGEKLSEHGQLLAEHTGEISVLKSKVP